MHPFRDGARAGGKGGGGGRGDGPIPMVRGLRGCVVRQTYCCAFMAWEWKWGRGGGADSAPMTWVGVNGV